MQQYHLLVAVDGSETSDEAVEYAGDLGATFDAVTHVIHVSPDLREVIIPGFSVGPARDSLMDSMKNAAQVILEKAETRLKELGVKDVRLLNEFGGAVQKICHAAERNNCTVIVIGSRGLGAIEGMLMGALSTKVVEQAPCNVLVVKPGTAKQLKHNQH